MSNATPESATSYGVMKEPSVLTIQRLLHGSAERVWQYITDGELRRKWLAAGPMPLQPDGAFELVWRNDTLTRPPGQRPEGFAEEQRMQGRVLAVDPPRSLEISWGDAGGSVLFELEPRGDRTLLTLTHRRLADGSRLPISAGWHVHLDIMAAILEGTSPPSFWDGWQARRAEYEKRFGA